MLVHGSWEWGAGRVSAHWSPRGRPWERLWIPCTCNPVFLPFSPPMWGGTGVV